LVDSCRRKTCRNCTLLNAGLAIARGRVRKAFGPVLVEIGRDRGGNRFNAILRGLIVAVDAIVGC
jgi:hypothetical protein